MRYKDARPDRWLLAGPIVGERGKCAVEADYSFDTLDVYSSDVECAKSAKAVPDHSDLQGKLIANEHSLPTAVTYPFRIHEIIGLNVV